MFVIGVTGCAGSGKSYVLDCAKTLTHAPVIDSDRVCRGLMGPGGEAYENVVKEFGTPYLREDGTLDREKLAKDVFADEEALTRLNAATHPATIRAINDMIASYAAAGEQIVFVESALAEQAGYREFCREIWVVCASEEVRLERLRKRGYSEERIADLMSRQLSQERMISMADRIITNSRDNDYFGILHQLMFHLDGACGRQGWVRCAEFGGNRKEPQ
ncbi:MAG: dephospho-CoA kinase [Lachnospiraceae bacterium]|nr:dephospho-CoA kinase [Lachnospiraceae bacterium]